jgi:glutathione S-transferase
VNQCNSIKQSILYGSSRSPFARRVRLALLSRSIQFEWKELSLSEIFPPSAELLRVNPLGLIPAFESANGVCLGDSNEILTFLDENICGLWHSDTEIKTKLRRVSALAHGVMTYAVREFQGLHVVSPDGQYAEDNVALISRVLSAIDQSLNDTPLAERVSNARTPQSGNVNAEWPSVISFSQAAWDVGVALDYLDFRLDEKIQWRSHGYQSLAQLHNELELSVFFSETKPK